MANITPRRRHLSLLSVVMAVAAAVPLLRGCQADAVATRRGTGDGEGNPRWPPRRASSYSNCQLLDIAFCQHLHYNQTVYPNLLHHRSQQDAEVDLSQYSSLARANCHPDLTHFLCVLFAPVCTILNRAIPPCRSMCLDVQRGCVGLLKRFDLSWPQQLSCGKFPVDDGTAVCIKLPSKEEGHRKSKRVGENGVVETAISSEFKLECSKKDELISIRKIRQTGKKCLTKTMKQMVTSRCEGKKNCLVLLSPLLPSHCSGKSDSRLKIKFKCTKVARGHKLQRLSYGEKTTLKCRGRREIRILGAVFGDGKSCDTPDAHCRLSQQCNNNSTCAVAADPALFASKCTSGLASLQLQYECIRRRDVPISEASAAGSETLSISCSAKRKIVVLSVTYDGVGMACRTDGVYCVVFALCNDKPRCVVPDLTFFKRQCAGDQLLQRLHVTYQCVA